MRMGEDEVMELIVLGGQVYSLYLPIAEDGETLLADVVEDETASAFMDDVLYSADDVLMHLTEQEKVVVRLRYGLEDGQAHTQRETAQVLGVALSTVVAVDRMAKRRLRKALEVA